MRASVERRKPPRDALRGAHRGSTQSGAHIIRVVPVNGMPRQFFPHPARRKAKPKATGAESRRANAARSDRATRGSLRKLEKRRRKRRHGHVLPRSANPARTPPPGVRTAFHRASSPTHPPRRNTVPMYTQEPINGRRKRQSCRKYSPAGTPGLGGGLVTRLGRDSVGLAVVLRHVGVHDRHDVGTDGGREDGRQGSLAGLRREWGGRHGSSREARWHGNRSMRVIIHIFFRSRHFRRPDRTFLPSVSKTVTVGRAAMMLAVEGVVYSVPMPKRTGVRRARPHLWGQPW